MSSLSSNMVLMIVFSSILCPRLHKQKENNRAHCDFVEIIREKMKDVNATVKKHRILQKICIWDKNRLAYKKQQEEHEKRKYW